MAADEAAVAFYLFTSLRVVALVADKVPCLRVVDTQLTQYTWLHAGVATVGAADVALHFFCITSPQTPMGL